MRRRIAVLALATGFVLCASLASAQVISTIKTPPLAASDSIILPINVHIPQANLRCRPTGI